MKDDPRYEKAIQWFRNARYFDAHEAWEELWHEASGADKTLLQGLIQAAVALHHLNNGNRKGADTLYPKVRKKLEGGGDDAREVLGALERSLRG